MFKILFTQLICNAPMNCDILHDMLSNEYKSEKICRNELIDYVNNLERGDEYTFINTDRGFVAKSKAVELKGVGNYSKQIECIDITGI